MASSVSSMSSTRELGLLLVATLALVGASGCGLTRPPDPPPFDCATVDRAAERFPAECGEEASEDDAGVEADDASTE